MRIEFNIGLNVASGDNGLAAVGARHSIALRALDNMLRGSASSERHTRVERAQHMGADGATPTEEVTLVAALVADDLLVQHELVYSLAVLLGQDCIAVYLPEQGIGHLIGPRADAWGAFDLDYFVRH